MGSPIVLKIVAGEYFIYIGAALMAAAIVAALICIIVFILSGQKLKERLRQEYGEPWRYNM